MVDGLDPACRIFPSASCWATDASSHGTPAARSCSSHESSPNPGPRHHDPSRKAPRRLDPLSDPSSKTEDARLRWSAPLDACRSAEYLRGHAPAKGSRQRAPGRNASSRSRAATLGCAAYPRLGKRGRARPSPAFYRAQPGAPYARRRTDPRPPRYGRQPSLPVRCGAAGGKPAPVSPLAPGSLPRPPASVGRASCPARAAPALASMSRARGRLTGPGA